MEYYFAYGSNLSESRMRQRGMIFTNKESAVLWGWELKFNKLMKDGTVAGNIVENHNSYVEGILWQIDDITVMDKYEGYPKHYDRQLMPVSLFHDQISPAYVDTKMAWVYIAHPDKVVEGLLPKKEYIAFLLEGKDYLTEDYYKNILDLYNIL